MKKILDIKVKNITFTSKYLAGLEDGMTNPPEIQALEPWDDGGLESTLEIDMDDDELLFDEIADNGVDADEEQFDSSSGIASWRRIEMAKEDKYLQSVLADLDDYYDFDDSADDMVAGGSH